MGTALIGDRVQVLSGEIEDHRITLSVIRAGPDDAACCPTEKALVSWELGMGGPAVVTDQVTGRLSLADLGGQIWELLELGRGTTFSDDFEITLQFEDDRVSGSSGCNTYFATAQAPGPGRLGFNAMGTTRMACEGPVMEIEREYLRTLAAATGYSFLAGRLALTCETDEGPVVLVFAPRDRR
jgi:heat shock protein HslJ